MFHSVPVTLQPSVVIDRVIVGDRGATVDQVLLTEQREGVLLKVQRVEAPQRTAGHGRGIATQRQAAGQIIAAHHEVVRETEPVDQEVDQEERGVMLKEAEQEAGEGHQETGFFI